MARHSSISAISSHRSVHNRLSISGSGRVKLTNDEKEELKEHIAQSLQYQLAYWRKHKGSYEEYEKIIRIYINQAFHSGEASQEDWNTT